MKPLAKLVLLPFIIGIVFAFTIGPAVAFFVWGWKVALEWYFVTAGIASLSRGITRSYSEWKKGV